MATDTANAIPTWGESYKVRNISTQGFGGTPKNRNLKIFYSGDTVVGISGFVNIFTASQIQITSSNAYFFASVDETNTTSGTWTYDFQTAKIDYKTGITSSEISTYYPFYIVVSKSSTSTDYGIKLHNYYSGNTITIGSNTTFTISFY